MAAKSPKRKNALGRGLGALLEDSTNNTVSSDIASSAGGSLNEIPLDQIQVNPYQPRTHFDRTALEELAESIKVQGIIQPITVRKLSDKEYQLISGERRFQASKIAGLENIPAYIRTADDQQMLEMALIENIQRENLNAIEIALSYQRLLDECNLKQEELGDRVGKNRTTVNNYLRLLRLPPDIQAGIRDQKISMGHARAIINVEDVAKQLYIYNKTVDEGLSVRKVEQLVRDLMSKSVDDPKPEKKGSNHHKNYEVQQIQTKLSSHFGTRVSLKADGQFRGEIKIPFVSTEDLNRILEIISL
ncbi:ParB/RepB/Spo0J family partition protein [Roseivirga thermotolerans]|uniref:Chromosome partitioning protein ParB n=1 Tax=Roseivirga thermotolerans TaxID=1758176 RepID=A0ABQ3IAF0_9BACT|nr:ParB/RepB/Spo0J family partition protein [Roseivirga thermotolerans]GHE68864.1 chromosome partitioning protein ParB [Roseivirga thermotolerans]